MSTGFRGAFRHLDFIAIDGPEQLGLEPKYIRNHSFKILHDLYAAAVVNEVGHVIADAPAIHGQGKLDLPFKAINQAPALAIQQEQPAGQFALAVKPAVNSLDPVIVVFSSTAIPGPVSLHDLNNNPKSTPVTIPLMKNCTSVRVICAAFCATF